MLEERRKGYIDNLCKGMFIQKAILSMLSKDVARTGEEEGEWKASRVDRLEVFFWNQVLEWVIQKIESRGWRMGCVKLL